MGIFLNPPSKTGLRRIFSNFFQNRLNYIILVSHIVFSGQLKVAEHISNKILMWWPLFDSLRHHFWQPHLKKGQFWPFSLTTGSKARIRKKWDFCDFLKVLQ